jgi:hypothetical protein
MNERTKGDSMPDRERDRDEMEMADEMAAGKQRRVGLAVRSATARQFYCHNCRKPVKLVAAVSRAPLCEACGRWMTPSPLLRFVRVLDGKFEVMPSTIRIHSKAC